MTVKQYIDGNKTGYHVSLRCAPMLVCPRIHPSLCLNSYSKARLHAWNKTKNTKSFLPVDVDAILNIPLSTMKLDDFWAWGREKKDIFFMFGPLIGYFSQQSFREKLGSKGRVDRSCVSLFVKSVQRTMCVFFCKISSVYSRSICLLLMCYF